MAILNKFYELIKIPLRRLRLIRLNRNFLTFLVFLAISIAFWFMQTFKDNTTISQDYKLKIVGVPKNVIFTSDVPEKIKANISGRGYTFLNYYSKNDDRVIVVNYDELEHTSSKITIDNNTLRRSLTKKLGNALKVSTLSPAQVDIYYTNGVAKRVPIISKLKVTTGLQYALCGIKPLTDSASVYAPINIIDSIKGVYTESRKLENIEDTTVVRLAIKKIDRVKIVPDSVDVKACVDLFMEKIIPVKIYSINIPQNKVLRTFPPRANVVCRVNATRFNEISENDFTIAVDFSKVNPTDKTCKVELFSKPDGVSHVRISPENVEFIIEQTDR